MKLSGRGQGIQVMFTMVVFLIFAASSLLVVIFGAKVYKKTNENTNNNYDIRTSIGYITQKVHQNDRNNAIEIIKFGDGDAIVLDEEIDGTVYSTIIYTSEGKLKELFSSKDNIPKVESGQSIMDLKKITAEFVSENTIYIKSIGLQDNSEDIYLFLRSN